MTISEKARLVTDICVILNLPIQVWVLYRIIKMGRALDDSEQGKKK